MRMLEAPGQQLSLTDRDARPIKCQVSRIVGYNIQTAVDTTHHLIVLHDVTNVGIDRRQLNRIVKLAKSVMAPNPKQPLTVIADQGYYRGEELLACEQANIGTYVATADTSGKRSKGEFARNEFRYIPQDDEYQCPAGERLIYRYTREESGKQIRRCIADAPVG